MKVIFFSSLLLYISHFDPSFLQQGSFNHRVQLLNDHMIAPQIVQIV
jgi:hypothetical protein